MPGARAAAKPTTASGSIPSTALRPAPDHRARPGPLPEPAHRRAIRREPRPQCPLGNPGRSNFGRIEQPLGPTANFKARYLLFTNYGSFRAQNINQRLDLTITAKVYDLLSMNFQSTVLYQHDQYPGIQFSQGLGLGLLLTRQKPVAPAK